MSLSDQLINVIELDGTTKQIKLYTDVSDVTEVYKDFLYNGQTLYASTTTDPNDEYATGLKYLDENGVVRYLCTENPIPEKSGTVVINGDLSTDLVVDGNLQVSGTISGNATASGKITYGALTGTATAGASFSSCDISVEDGTLTFRSSVSKSSGALYTTGSVSDSDKTTITHLYSSLTIYLTSGTGLTTWGTFTIENGSTVDATGTGYGVYNNGGSFTVNGKLSAQVPKPGSDEVYGVYIYSGGSFTVNGTLTASAENTGYVAGGLYIRGTNSNFTSTNGSTVDVSGSTDGVCVDVGSLIINGVFTATGTRGSSYGIYINYNGTVTVGGTLYVVSNSSNPIYGGTVTTTGSGKVYVNGVLQ